MAAAPAPLTGLLAEGEELWRAQLAAVSDDAFAGPTLLPGWDRAHLVAHLAGNAQALRNLIVWAATGVETPMYADAGARNQQIEELSALPPGELRAACVQQSEELLSAWGALPPAQWQAEVRTFHGRPIPAANVCWMRARETHIHAIDLNSGLTFADLPDQFLDPFLDDVTTGLSAKEAPSVALRDEASGREWLIGTSTSGDRVLVTGSASALAQWACGRGEPASLVSSSGALPPLPPWL